MEQNAQSEKKNQNEKIALISKHRRPPQNPTEYAKKQGTCLMSAAQENE